MVLTRLSEIAEPIDRFETVTPEAEYRLLGMRSRIGGPFLREIKNGGEISAGRLNRVENGDFIYSRLFAWQGSFGLIPPQLHGCYVSNEFPLFRIDRDRALPKYLVYWFGLPQIQKHVESDCTGSTPGTRNRYNERHFFRLSLELPTLEVQYRIVAKVQGVADRLAEAKRLRQEIQDDSHSLLHSVFHRLIQGAAYRPLGEVAPIVRRPVAIELDGAYPELGVRSFGRGTFHKPTLIGADLDWQKLFRVQAGDLVISNIKAWEGAIAVVGPDDHGRVGSHRYITCVAKEGVTTPEFLCFYLLTNAGIEQVQAASPGSADRNRTLAMSRLGQIIVPVPTIDKQLEFSALQAKVAAIRQAQAANQPEL
ncbi:MAG TPA: restriction endonuclease subunit S, partial [Lamprocystis sp. (in: g-proteobacteria)]|nr:restriction endonuclease subunit S [Lamprocystis sp. (in: g-proteobacteria)]